MSVARGGAFGRRFWRSVWRSHSSRLLWGGTGAVLLLFVVGCASSGVSEGARRASAEEPEKAEETTRITVKGDIDFTAAPYRNLLSTPPRGGQPCFFASVPRKADREEEYEAGLTALAYQAARWRKAEVTAKYLTKKEGREMGYLEEVEVEVPPELVRDMREEIEVLTSYADRSGSYLQGTLAGELPGDMALPSEDAAGGTMGQGEQQNGRPEWVLSPPELAGYLTAVGAGNRHMYFADSIRSADEQALANLARQVSVEVERKRLDLERGGGTLYTQYTIQISEAVLRGAYILERWISPDGSDYYSLAVAPRQQ